MWKRNYYYYCEFIDWTNRMMCTIPAENREEDDEEPDRVIRTHSADRDPEGQWEDDSQAR